MKYLILTLIALGLAANPMQAGEKKRFVLYAVMLEKTPVELSDGAKWRMDKGDTFPLSMYKNNMTKVVLQLAGVTFWVDADKVQVIEEKDVTHEQMETYRQNVETYLANRARQWKEKAADSDKPKTPGNTLFPTLGQ